MLACVYPAENFEVKTVTVKLHHGKSKRKSKSPLAVKEKLSDAAGATGCGGNGNRVGNELVVGGGGAVLVLSELESMAARQQREIAQQRRLLEQREARLAVLRGAQEPAQQDKLARLKHRLDQQQSKLNRLRLLRSQTDQSRANNATLSYNEVQYLYMHIQDVSNQPSSPFNEGNEGKHETKSGMHCPMVIL
ncbi:hypothetical protein EAI_12239 [Harpegnathos saltator]|uniref:Apoptosis-stimulating of p53 protein 1 n=1 Tax=Harpegnathos saltator TaxID=610380 RepID=E2B3P0_HARSA|nr:hypothetical protein EAI_12239 [Harpegnathos saltator]